MKVQAEAWVVKVEAAAGQAGQITTVDSHAGCQASWFSGDSRYFLPIGTRVYITLETSEETAA